MNIIWRWLIRQWLIAVFISALMLFQAAQAVGIITLSIEQIFVPLQSTATRAQQSAPPFIKALRLDKLKLEMDIRSEPALFTVSLEHFNLPEPYTRLKQLQFSCQSLEITASAVDCQGKNLSLTGLFQDETATSKDFSFHYSLLNQSLSLVIRDLNIGQGTLTLSYAMADTGWQVDFKASQLDFKQFKPYFDFYYPEFMASVSDAGLMLNASGTLHGQFARDEQDQSGGLKTLKIDGRVSNLHYVRGDDLADKLSFNFTYKLTKNSDQNTRMFLDLSRIKGEIFQNDIYLAFTGSERILANLLIDSKSNILKINRLKLLSDDLLDVEGSAVFQQDKDYRLKDYHLAFKLHDLAKLNRLYLKNILEGSNYEGLELEGGVKGYFGRSGKKIQLNTIFSQFNLDFNGQVSVLELAGELNWNNHKTPENSPQSHLRWQELRLNELPFGQTQLDFVTYNDRLSLLKETDIPLFDGALHINTLDVTQIGQFSSEEDQVKGMTLVIDGLIKPISLAQVSEYFNWPILDGKLSAVIPQTTYNSHLLTVGGAMMMQVFDGTIIFKDLKVVNPLSDQAGFFANIDLLNIDLKSLTKTFNFGEIEGRMEGKVRNLELFAWSPVAFDASFKTPEHDGSRHRISQRAIDNLSSLGGASGILSRSFLSIFETFRYDKIGLSCKLKNNTCYMNGVEPKGDNAYYIVKGSGLPRIDVMGFQKAVNWQVLISRLKNIQSANEAVIE